MSRFVDSIIAYRILRLLVTPFVETDAYKLGIIDEKGKELKRMNQLNTVQERDAYSILHRMIFRIKRIIEKVPVENKKILSFTAALALIKEHASNKNEPINLETLFLEKLNHLRQDSSYLTEDTKLVQEFLYENKTLTFKQFLEDAPANNAVATPGIDGLTPETLGVRKPKKKVLKRQEVKYVTSSN